MRKGNYLGPPTQERLKEIFYINVRGNLSRRIPRGNQVAGSRAGTETESGVMVQVDGGLYKEEDLLECYRSGFSGFKGAEREKSKRKGDSICDRVKLDPFGFPKKAAQSSGYYTR